MTAPRPRARLLTSTIAVVQEHGVHAAGLAELLKRSNASRNSLYQHFPAGKGQLVETAARVVSRVVHSHVAAMADKLASTPSVAQWLDELFAFWLEPLESSEYRLGSFMMAAALDELDPVVQATAGQAFDNWTTRLADGMVAAGIEESNARSTAGVLLSVIEGAIVQSRALESNRPFADAHAQLRVLLELHLTKTDPQAGGTPSRTE
ncbi:TetR/AcrR family transcriptional regulator [Prescottella agglutinans]|uniref:TetR/AcrR family transcriptional repressor of lmrAB and yxaGH operons n=1 Tax=Prescottella agglutinans TaxID=1644129 RepID=A0ABT6M7V6_9NOCA|nr:TetR/AcrR family transcriptional regulator [Prescottella agglutinans]MDH6280395.1 TetR/AcrR family transcriptional repressor of lmrAB and yxaGH operons [Prescottella agglutinans]